VSADGSSAGERRRGRRSHRVRLSADRRKAPRCRPRDRDVAPGEKWARPRRLGADVRPGVRRWHDGAEERLIHLLQHAVVHLTYKINFRRKTVASCIRLQAIPFPQVVLVAAVVRTQTVLRIQWLPYKTKYAVSFRRPHGARHQPPLMVVKGTVNDSLEARRDRRRCRELCASTRRG
jgi:hypothetical protein